MADAYVDEITVAQLDGQPVQGTYDDMNGEPSSISTTWRGLKLMACDESVWIDTDRITIESPWSDLSELGTLLDLLSSDVLPRLRKLAEAHEQTRAPILELPASLADDPAQVANWQKSTPRARQLIAKMQGIFDSMSDNEAVAAANILHILFGREEGEAA